MSTQEIPRNDWPAFFDGFSLKHQGWLVRLEVFGSDVGAQVMASGLPLQGITVDLKDDGEDMISIFVGKTQDDHVTHTIHWPTHVMLKQTEEGADEVLEIESADKTTTLVRFRSAMLPELVDGIL